MKAKLRLIIFCFGSACATHSPAPNADPSQTATTPPPEREGVVDLRGIWGLHDLDARGARERGLDPALVKAPVKVRTTNPQYPASALNAGVQGKVVAECVIDVDGTPRDCRVTRGVSPDLDAETLHTMQAWRYKPLRLAGVARPALVELSITYSVSSN